MEMENDKKYLRDIEAPYMELVKKESDKYLRGIEKIDTADLCADLEYIIADVNTKLPVKLSPIINNKNKFTDEKYSSEFESINELVVEVAVYISNTYVMERERRAANGDEFEVLFKSIETGGYSTKDRLIQYTSFIQELYKNNGLKKTIDFQTFEENEKTEYCQESIRYLCYCVFVVKQREDKLLPVDGYVYNLSADSSINLKIIDGDILSTKLFLNKYCGNSIFTYETTLIDTVNKNIFIGSKSVLSNLDLKEVSKKEINDIDLNIFDVIFASDSIEIEENRYTIDVEKKVINVLDDVDDFKKGKASRLVKINSKDGVTIKKYFNIVLSDYGVIIKDEFIIMKDDMTSTVYIPEVYTMPIFQI